MHNTQSDRPEGRSTRNAPRNRRFEAHNRAVGPLLICAVALGTILASSAFPQVLAGTILLPDSLGPLTGATHVALDESPAHPRMFIGSDSGDVLVVNSLTGERVARMETGPVRAICFCPARNKLYISLMNSYAVVVLDCNTYETIAELQIGRLVSRLLYNPLVDRVYCAMWGMKVIDCATDSIVDSLPIPARNAVLALDTIHNKLYVGATDTFRVVDCGTNSIVASLYELRGAEAVCFAPSASGSKVYVGVDDTLFALSVKTDTVVYRCHFPSVNPIVCDPELGRVYFGHGGILSALDCANDSVIWTWYDGPANKLVAVPAEGKVYVLTPHYVYVLDGETGEVQEWLNVSSVGGMYHCQSLNRLFIFTREENGYSLMIDCSADTVVTVTPLGAYVGYLDGSVCVDSVDNELYFSAGASGVGIVDCATNKVTSYICPSRLRYRVEPATLVYDAVDNKLYCLRDTIITVVDCRSDTGVGVIPTGVVAGRMEWHPGLNKLYVSGWIRNQRSVAVVDCSEDSIVGVIQLPDSTGGIAFLSPERNELWFYGFYVVDCLGDSLLPDTGVRINCQDAGYDPSSRKVYAASSLGTAMYVIDMDTRLPTESLSIPKSYQQESGPVHCAVRAHKVYWVVQYYDPDSALVRDTVCAIDARCDSVVSRFAIPPFCEGVCDDRTGNYVYLASGGELVAVDVLNDSTVSSVRIASGAHSFIRNSATNRFYIAGNSDSVIQVVYDSIIFAGIQSRRDASSRVDQLQTVLRRGTPFLTAAESALFDATGRRAAVLSAGLNDISQLSPGVYFIREEPRTAGFMPGVARKVVVTR